MALQRPSIARELLAATSTAVAAAAGAAAGAAGAAAGAAGAAAATTAAAGAAAGAATGARGAAAGAAPAAGAAGVAATPARHARLAALLVFACFTFTSAGYMAWLYRLTEVAPPGTIEPLSLGAAYLCQGIGIGAGALLMRYRPALRGRTPLMIAIAGHLACAAAAVTADDFAIVATCGCAMSCLCGFVAAVYLQALAQYVTARRRGIAFGGAYGCSVVVAWLLSLLWPNGPSASTELASCAVFSAFAAFVVVRLGNALKDGGKPGSNAATRETWQTAQGAGTSADAATRETQPAGHENSIGTDAPAAGAPWLGTLALASLAVLLMSITKSVGFAFPAADIGTSVSVETMRLLYAGGLVVAGLIVDRSRKTGALLCVAALCLPFALLVLQTQEVPHAALWALGYLLIGVFSVFRCVLFCDLAENRQQPELAGFGLMFGRVGDALGALICLTFGGSAIALVAAASALFAATLFPLFGLSSRLRKQQPESASSTNTSEAEARKREIWDQQRLQAFCDAYKLSRREQEVLRLLLSRWTNPEIAEELVVTESTVKFHVRNVLKKTGCKNRIELQELFAAETEYYAEHSPQL